jgi:two-component system chemotaxis sensor kinase CheA
MTGIDLTQFYQAFFEEADELLADMESLLLKLDVADPDKEQLNAIFRAAHSIKGGAATFGTFAMLAETTHLLESLLDPIRRGETALQAEMIDVFLRAKDVLKHQVDAYRDQGEPDSAEAAEIASQLKQFIVGGQAQAAQSAPIPAPPEPPPEPPAVAAVSLTLTPELQAQAQEPVLRVRFTRINDKDSQTLLEELGNLGTVLAQERQADNLEALVATSCPAADIEAVACFVVNSDQIQISLETTPGAVVAESIAATQQAPEAPTPASDPAPLGQPPSEALGTTAATAASAATAVTAAAQAVSAVPAASPKKSAAPAHDKESSSIRVGVEKLDQVINLVGELVITQAMLAQTASTLDPVLHDRLLSGLEQLDRNARALQEAVMSIRMIPMEYVFSRFPRVVRDLAATTGKKIQLETVGKATELDKGLIERIIDPLTHLVRNSLDHGIELPADRVAAGKPAEGRLTLSAQHLGGNIVIEVSDDGRGLNREKILAKAAQSGIVLPENAPDEEVWQLIFAPGLSTAETVTAISGRGVGMDVVRRNIQDMGGHVQLLSSRGKGTITRIVLPLTLAILDGMSVRVGHETFILPLGHVAESIQPQNDQIYTVAGGERVLHVRGDYLPLVELHRTFGVQQAQTDPTQAIAVIMHAQERRYALLVDHLIGQHQVVVKNLETNYRKVPGISAATILGDGSVALIIDVFALGSTGREIRLQAQVEAVTN